MGVTKYVLPVIVGAMSGMILITIGEKGIYMVYPLPAGTDLYYADSVAKYLAQLPEKAFILFMVNYVVCSFIGGVIATLVAGRTTLKPVLIAGFILMLAGIYRVMLFPVPKWFAVLSILAYMPCAWLGYLAGKKKAEPAHNAT